LKLIKNLFYQIYFFLKVSPKVCIERIKKERFEITLFEREKILRKVWKNYEILAKKFKNVYIITEKGRLKKFQKKLKKSLLKNYGKNKRYLKNHRSHKYKSKGKK
jgi:thymidylate kinase